MMPPGPPSKMPFIIGGLVLVVVVVVVLVVVIYYLTKGSETPAPTPMPPAPAPQGSGPAPYSGPAPPSPSPPPPGGYTYTYTGPAFQSSSPNGSDDTRLLVTFKTASPLPANTEFITASAATAKYAVLKVVRSGITISSLQVSDGNFKLHTNSSGLIDAWFIFGNDGTHQAYTMNTMSYVLRGINGKTGYDQATWNNGNSGGRTGPPAPINSWSVQF